MSAHFEIFHIEAMKGIAITFILVAILHQYLWKFVSLEHSYQFALFNWTTIFKFIFTSLSLHNNCVLSDDLHTVSSPNLTTIKINYMQYIYINIQFHPDCPLIYQYWNFTLIIWVKIRCMLVVFYSTPRCEANLVYDFICFYSVF